jgi:hypothetical protein
VRHVYPVVFTGAVIVFVIFGQERSVQRRQTLEHHLQILQELLVHLSVHGNFNARLQTTNAESQNLTLCVVIPEVGGSNVGLLVRDRDEAVITAGVNPLDDYVDVGRRRHHWDAAGRNPRAQDHLRGRGVAGFAEA